MRSHAMPLLLMLFLAGHCVPIGALDESGPMSMRQRSHGDNASHDHDHDDHEIVDVWNLGMSRSTWGAVFGILLLICLIIVGMCMCVGCTNPCCYDDPDEGCCRPWPTYRRGGYAHGNNRRNFMQGVRVARDREEINPLVYAPMEPLPEEVYGGQPPTSRV